MDNVLFAKAVGADFVGSLAGLKEPDTSDCVTAARLIDTYRKAFSLLEQERVDLGNLMIVEEAEPVECFSDLSIAKAVINEVDHPNLKLLFDVAHMNT